MAFKQRHSKFKHVFGTPYKKDICYDNVRITKSPWDSNMCDVNGKFLAVVLESQGGGGFIVIPLEKVGRVDINHPKISGHKSNVLDLAWNPFNENEIASASEDCTVKIWEIPDGGLKDNVSEPNLDLQRHQRKVGCIVWHPTAENVLASAGADAAIFIWNTGTGDLLFEIEDLHTDLIYCISWNYNGSLLVSSCKDKKIRIIDPRKNEVIAEKEGHQGNKPTKVVFCGSLRFVFSTGFSRSNERQYAVWDMNLKQLYTDSLDSNSGTLFCFYDEGTKMVYLVGKGDGNIRYYEILPSTPYAQYLSTFVTSNPQRGIGFMPKRYLNHKECEVARLYKLHNKGLIEPVSMTVPRKSEMFQEDIYPPCEAGVPALSAEEWASGVDKPPVLVVITKDGLGGQTAGATLAPVAKSTGKSLSKQSSHSSTGSVGNIRSHSPDRESSPSLTSSGNHDVAKLDDENRKLRSENQTLRSEIERLKAQLEDKDSILHQIKKMVQ